MAEICAHAARPRSTSARPIRSASSRWPTVVTTRRNAGTAARGGGGLLAVVGGANLRVGEQRLGVAAHRHFAAVHDVAARGELERPARVLLDQQDRRALAM